MSRKRLKFDSFEVNKKEFHASKRATDFNLVDINKIAIPDKFKHNEQGFKYFIGDQDDNIVRLLCIVLRQMSEYIKYFENGEKKMSFLIEGHNVLVKYNEIWKNIKKTLNIKFHCMPLYNRKYIRAKVKEFNGAVNINFWGDKVPKEGVHHTCIACISMDSVMKMEKKNYPQVY